MELWLDLSLMLCIVAVLAKELTGNYSEDIQDATFNAIDADGNPSKLMLTADTQKAMKVSEATNPVIGDARAGSLVPIFSFTSLGVPEKLRGGHEGLLTRIPETVKDAATAMLFTTVAGSRQAPYHLLGKYLVRLFMNQNEDDKCQNSNSGYTKDSKECGPGYMKVDYVRVKNDIILGVVLGL